MAVMTERAVRHPPVIEQGKVLGMISIGDLVKDTISDQTFVIDQLVHIIHGARWRQFETCLTDLAPMSRCKARRSSEADGPRFNGNSTASPGA